MNFSNKFLAKCDALRQAGFETELEPGVIVGRGFADLGYELFSVLPGDKLLSLFTGKTSVIDSNERERLFLVPDADDLIKFLQKKLGYALNCQTQDGRSWNVSLGQKNFPIEEKSPSLTESLIEVAIMILTSGSDV
jgi:hypothetical protein